MTSSYSRFEPYPAPAVLGIRALLHQPVLDTAGQTLGRIEDFILDAETGTVAYAVLVVSALHSPDKRFALPWHLLRKLPSSGAVMVDLDREALSRSPGMPFGGLESPSARSETACVISPREPLGGCLQRPSSDLCTDPDERISW